MCFVHGPAPNRSVKELAAELSLFISTPDSVNRSQGLSNLTSFHHCVKLRLSNAHSCQALKSGSRFHSVVTNLSHQSRRTLPRDWVASKVAVTKKKKTVILSGCSCLRNRSATLDFANKYRAAKSHSRRSIILWAKCFAVSARSYLFFGHI